MSPIMEWGLDFIIAIQQIQGPVVNSIFKAITFLGEEYFLLIFVPFLIWSVDARIGIRVGVIYLLSAYINVSLKSFFNEPRPFEIDPSVKLAHAEGSGMPSGHAQSSVLVWGMLASQIHKNRKWVWPVAVLLMFLVGFSRVYLGVHFPHQVLAGWGFGAGILLVALWLQTDLEGWLSRLSLQYQILLSLVVPAVAVLIYTVNDTVASGATLSGFGVGLALTHHYLHLETGGEWWKRAVRFLVGLVIMLAIYFGLSAIFPGEDSSLYHIFRYLRYGLVGMWISLGAPWLFCQIHLMEEEMPTAVPSKT